MKQKAELIKTLDISTTEVEISGKTGKAIVLELNEKKYIFDILPPDANILKLVNSLGEALHNIAGTAYSCEKPNHN
jgi:hypothetical protein